MRPVVPQRRLAHARARSSSAPHCLERVGDPRASPRLLPHILIHTKSKPRHAKKSVALRSGVFGENSTDLSICEPLLEGDHRKSEQTELLATG